MKKPTVAMLQTQITVLSNELADLKTENARLTKAIARDPRQGLFVQAPTVQASLADLSREYCREFNVKSVTRERLIEWSRTR